MSQSGASTNVCVFWTEGAVCGLDRADGALLWTWGVDEEVTKKKKGFWKAAELIQLVSVDAGHVLVALMSGQIFCLDLLCGGVRWSTSVPALKGAPLLANKARRVPNDEDGLDVAALGLLGTAAIVASSSDD